MQRDFLLSSFTYIKYLQLQNDRHQESLSSDMFCLTAVWSSYEAVFKTFHFNLKSFCNTLSSFCVLVNCRKSHQCWLKLSDSNACGAILWYISDCFFDKHIILRQYILLWEVNRKIMFFYGIFITLNTKFLILLFDMLDINFNLSFCCNSHNDPTSWIFSNKVICVSIIHHRNMRVVENHLNWKLPWHTCSFTSACKLFTPILYNL